MNHPTLPTHRPTNANGAPMNLLDRLLGRTGAHRRTYRVWKETQQRLAGMDAQDELIANLARQRDDLVAERDHARGLVAAAGAQVEQFRHWATDAEQRATSAEQSATQLRSQVANLKAVSVSMYATDTPTQELHVPPLTPVMSLQARGAA